MMRRRQVDDVFTAGIGLLTSPFRMSTVGVHPDDDVLGVIGVQQAIESCDGVAGVIVWLDVRRDDHETPLPEFEFNGGDIWAGVLRESE